MKDRGSSSLYEGSETTDIRADRSVFIITPFVGVDPAEYESRQKQLLKTLILFYRIYGLKVTLHSVVYNPDDLGSSFHTRVIKSVKILKRSDIVLIDACYLEEEEKNYDCVMLSMVTAQMKKPYATIQMPNIIVEAMLPDWEMYRLRDEPIEITLIPTEVVEKEESLQYEWTRRRP